MDNTFFVKMTASFFVFLATVSTAVCIIQNMHYETMKRLSMISNYSCSTQPIFNINGSN